MRAFETVTKSEQQFVRTIAGKKTHLQVFRGNQKAGTGDFFVVDASNPRNPRVVAVELKTQAGSAHAGIQLGNAPDVLKKAGFKNIDTFTGTLEEFLEYMGLK